MNHTLTTFSHDVATYLGLPIHPKRKDWHESIQIVHQDNSNLLTSIFQR